MATRWLVTGFGPFRDIKRNPSARLAGESGCPHKILDVSFRAVDEFLDQLDPTSFDRWLMIGVHGSAEQPIYEQRARNAIGASADVEGVTLGPGAIDPSAPPSLATTLLIGLEPTHGAVGHDPGAYLCNYLYFQGLRRFPNKQIGFLHVPRGESTSAEAMREILSLV